MAGEERTEKPTAKHRRRAQEKGQTARSADLSGSVVLVAGLAAVAVTGHAIVSASAAALRGIFAQIAKPNVTSSAAGLNGLMHFALSTIMLAVLPVAGVCVAAALVIGVAQVGVRPTPQALKPDFKRINPASGLRNLIGPNLIFETGKAVTKIAVVGAAAAMAILPGLTALSADVGVPPMQVGSLLSGRATEIAEHAAFAYVLIGVIDYAWKRYQHEKKLKMTKQEVKDEVRQYGVSAEVKAALRRRQMQIARARMMAAVATADVVVTNPTHFAVALLYDGSRTAPEVVAKGQDLIAAQIRRIAEENEVPVVADPPLARALHSSTEIGQVIPEELYAAVARVLAFVYRMAGRRRLAS